MFQMNPALGIYSPPKQRLQRGQLAGFKAKKDFAKLMGQNMSPGTAAYFAGVKAKAKAKRNARESVKAVRDARRMRREMRDESLAAKRAARALKRRRAAARGPINVLTMSPGTIEAILARRAKAGAAGLARRMRNPAFAARYRQKVLGRKYRQGGRLLGATYKAPVEKRKTRRMQRKQGGVGLRKGDLAGLVGMNTSLMRYGDYGSKASLMDYAQLMRDKARAAYIRRKRRMGKGSLVRTPMTAAQKKAKRASAYRRKMAARGRTVRVPMTVAEKKAKRAAAYRAKKAARAARASMFVSPSSNTSSPLSVLLSAVGSASPPRRVVTRAAASRKAAQAQAQARARSVAAAAAARRMSTRASTRAAAPRKSARIASRR